MRRQKSSSRNFRAERMIRAKPRRLGKAWCVPSTKRPTRLELSEGESARDNASSTKSDLEFQLWTSSPHVPLSSAVLFAGSACQGFSSSSAAHAECVRSGPQKRPQPTGLTQGSRRGPWDPKSLMGGKGKGWVSEG